MHESTNRSSGEACVLVVDDDRDTAETTAWLLRLRGFEAHIAFSGYDAIELVRKHAFDYVLLDLAMPGMDGYQLALHLREMPTCRRTSILAVSGYSATDRHQDSRTAGISAHLLKPVDWDQLLTLLSAPGRVEDGAGDSAPQMLGVPPERLAAGGSPN